MAVSFVLMALLTACRDETPTEIKDPFGVSAGQGGNDSGNGLSITFLGDLIGDPTAMHGTDGKKHVKWRGDTELTLNIDPALLTPSNCSIQAGGTLGDGNGLVAFVQSNSPRTFAFNNEAFNKSAMMYTGAVFSFVTTIDGNDYKVQFYRFREPYGTTTLTENPTTITSVGGSTGGKVEVFADGYEYCNASLSFTQIVE